jgi:hypothetical protein
MTTPTTDPEGNQEPTPEEEKAPVTEPKSKQPSSSDAEDWETRYKGQQKLTAKREQTIQRLQDKLDALTEKHEEAVNAGEKSAKEKTDTEKQLAELSAQLDAARVEQQALQTSLEQNSIVMEKFPDLTPLAKYIPTGDTAEEFAQNAEAFQKDIAAFVDAGVKTAMNGASPPTPDGKTQLATQAEKDSAYDAVVALAGVSGKEAEYEKARQKWVELSADSE